MKSIERPDGLHLALTPGELDLAATLDCGPVSYTHLGMTLDADSLAKAAAQGVCVLQTELPVYEASRALAGLLGL